MAAVTISEQGWPLQDPVTTFIDTPLIYIHASLISELTSLTIRPGVKWGVSVTSLLPIIYMLILLFTFYVFSRHISSGVFQPALIALPVFIWVPLYGIHTKFHRSSLGIVFFTLLVYMLHRKDPDKSWEFKILVLIILSSIVLTHHVAAFVTVIFILSLLMTSSTAPLFSRENKGTYGIITPIIGLFSLTVFVSWYIFHQNGLQLIVTTIMSVVETISVMIGLKQGSGMVVTQSSTELSQLQIIRFISVWIYQLVLSIPILYIIILNKMGLKRIDEWTKRIAIFGTIIAIGGLTAWKTGLIAFKRILTYFVIGGGAKAAMSLMRITRVRSIIYLFFIILLTSSSVLIPLHVVSDASPAYRHGENSQRFDGEDYSTSSHVNKFASHKIAIGDGNTKDVLSINKNVYVVTDPTPIQTGNISSDSIVLLRYPANEQLFFGTSGTTSVSIRGNDLSHRLSMENSKIYSSGQSEIYSTKGDK